MRWGERERARERNREGIRESEMEREGKSKQVRDMARPDHSGRLHGIQPTFSNILSA